MTGSSIIPDRPLQQGGDKRAKMGADNDLIPMGAPRSTHFNDVYFSAQDGLAETEYVFLKSNRLEERWRDLAYRSDEDTEDTEDGVNNEQKGMSPPFVIAETGFGTGLNFLAAWDLWRRINMPSSHSLHFISVEKYPLSRDKIYEYLSPWHDRFEGIFPEFIERYPSLIPGFHRIDFGGVQLTLIFDDVLAALPQLQAGVDCWFLDGFKPSENPDMWSESVFEHMARLSRTGASFATFTAAGFVRRGLQVQGFDVSKVKGFGTKRDMLTGLYTGDKDTDPMKRSES